MLTFLKLQKRYSTLLKHHQRLLFVFASFLKLLTTAYFFFNGISFSKEITMSNMLLCLYLFVRGTLRRQVPGNEDASIVFATHSPKGPICRLLLKVLLRWDFVYYLGQQLIGFSWHILYACHCPHTENASLLRVPPPTLFRKIHLGISCTPENTLLFQQCSFSELT